MIDHYSIDDLVQDDSLSTQEKLIHIVNSKREDYIKHTLCRKYICEYINNHYVYEDYIAHKVKIHNIVPAYLREAAFKIINYDSFYVLELEEWINEFMEKYPLERIELRGRSNGHLCLVSLTLDELDHILLEKNYVLLKDFDKWFEETEVKFIELCKYVKQNNTLPTKDYTK